MQSALFIGRFQPFHLGHLDVVKQILAENDRVIIVIGSAEKNFISSNPLTTSERFQLIEAGLKDAEIAADRYAIIPIRNINNYALWVNHVNMYVPPYDKIYTGSQLVKACYEGKYSYHHPEAYPGPEIIQVDRKLPISATEVRDRMIEGQNWQELVSPTVQTLLERWHIPDRLRTIKDTMDVTKYNNSY